MLIASAIMARTVSDTFFFCFNHSACSGVTQTITFCVFRSVAMKILQIGSQHFGHAPRLRDTPARCMRGVAVKYF